MQCNHCGSDNPARMTFCTRCGQRLSDEHGISLPASAEVPGIVSARQLKPAELEKWNTAGCLPFGIFAFAHGSMLWGLFTLLGSFLGFGIIGYIYLLFRGNRLAWNSRRYTDLASYSRAMHAWNHYGKLYSIILAILLGIFAIVALVFGLLVSGVNSLEESDSYIKHL